MVKTPGFANFQVSYHSVFHLTIDCGVFIGFESRDDGVSMVLTSIFCKRADKVDDSSNACSSHGMCHGLGQKRCVPNRGRHHGFYRFHSMDDSEMNNGSECVTLLVDRKEML